MTEPKFSLSPEAFRQDMQRLGLDIPEDFFYGALACTQELRNAVSLLNARRHLREEPACGFDILATLERYRADHE